jgi:hypothetical protein
VSYDFPTHGLVRFESRFGFPNFPKAYIYNLEIFSQKQQMYCRNLEICTVLLLNLKDKMYILTYNTICQIASYTFWYLFYGAHRSNVFMHWISLVPNGMAMLLSQNRVHRRPTCCFFLWFSYDFGVTRNSSSNADAMVLASARLRGIHPLIIFKMADVQGGMLLKRALASG